MDTKLDELKAKAEEMLKACRDENRKQETYEAVKAKLTGFLGDVKKLNDSDKNLSELADQVRAQIVSFMEKDLDSLKKDAQDKISAAVDEKTLQDTKVFFLGKKGKLIGHFKRHEGCFRSPASGYRRSGQSGQKRCGRSHCR